MRWWLLVLGGVVAISLIFWAVHPNPPMLGAAVLQRLIQADERTPVRGAIELIDYVPEAGLSVPPDWQRGSGSLPGIDLLGQLDPQHSFWVKGSNFRFVWSNPPSVLNPLRTALAAGSDVRRHVALALAPEDAAAAGKAVELAAHELSALSDEALFSAWLRSDREVLAEQEQLPAAARQALLLLARPNNSPVVTFNHPGGGHVYLVGLFTRTADTWLEVDMFDASGALVAGGTLQVDEAKPSFAADPADVRRIAAELSLLAFPPSSPAAASSTRPADAQLVH